MPDPTILPRRLGLRSATVVGLSAMLGAGVFVASGPAAAAAGSAVPIALALAALVAWCNADSSARLAARHPQSGGTYVYGREQLGPFWGYLAGWAFVVGKSASCAAMALAVGAYAWPDHAGTVAAGVVLALTALNCLGVHRSAQAGAAIVAVVLLVLAVVVATAFASDAADFDRLRIQDASAAGVLEAAGLLFFAFAGYARLATLGEEVRDPARTIPRAIRLAFGTVLVVYVAVLAATLAVLGAAGTAASTAPLADVVDAAGASALEPVVRGAATLAAGGALLALLLGVSRTALAMARDAHLPRTLAELHRGAPVRAEIAVGLVVAVPAATIDLGGAIGFSSFGVLLYYAIANASAWTLRRTPTAALGLVGCLALAFSLPRDSIVSGSAVVAAGALLYAARRARRVEDSAG